MNGLVVDTLNKKYKVVRNARLQRQNENKILCNFNFSKYILFYTPCRAIWLIHLSKLKTLFIIDRVIELDIVLKLLCLSSKRSSAFNLPLKRGEIFHILRQPWLANWPKLSSRRNNGNPAKMIMIKYGIRNAPVGNNKLAIHFSAPTNWYRAHKMSLQSANPSIYFEM